MRKIGTHPDKNIQSLADYLLTEGISSNVIENDSGLFDLWVVVEDKLEQAKSAFAEFQTNPADPKFGEASRQAKQIRKQQSEKKQRTANNVRTGRQSFERRTPITFFIVGLCIFVAIVSEFSMSPHTSVVRGMLFNFSIAENSQQLVQIGAEGVASGQHDSWEMTTASLRRGELWRLFTPALLHGSIAHLVMNLFVFIPFGRRIEANEGRWFTIGFMLVAAALPNLFQGLLPISMDGTGVFLERMGNGAILFSPFGGISGVCFALVAFCWQRGQTAFVPEYRMSGSLMALMILTLVIGFAGLDYSMLGIRFANWAHGIGLVVGLAAGSIPVGRTAKR